MHISTTQFGAVRLEETDVFHFPHGLIGLEEYRRWVLLADGGSDAFGWMQSTTEPDMAVAVVSPRRFVPDYRVRVSRRELRAIRLSQVDQAFMLNIVADHGDRLTVNLRAPLILNLDQRLGRQVVTDDDQPVQWELTVSPLKLRKSA